VIPNPLLDDHEESVKPRGLHLDAILMHALPEVCIGVIG